MCRCIFCGRKVPINVESTFGVSEAEQEEQYGQSLPWVLHSGWLELCSDPKITKEVDGDVYFMYVCPVDVPKLKNYLKIPSTEDKKSKVSSLICA